MFFFFLNDDFLYFLFVCESANTVGYMKLPGWRSNCRQLCRDSRMEKYSCLAVGQTADNWVETADSRMDKYSWLDGCKWICLEI